MTLKHKKEDQTYIVYAYIEYANYTLYWILNSEEEFICFKDEDIELIDTTPSKHWKTILSTRTGATYHLPYEWVKEIPSEYYNDRMDEIDGFWSTLDDLYGTSCTFMSKNNDCTYINEINAEYPEFVANIDNVTLEALPLGDNWVLCPECDEAFEVNITQNIVTCPNVACKVQLYNPYVK